MGVPIDSDHGRQSTADPCLTIGVPTFNRSDLLPDFLQRLVDAVSPVADHILIDIVDNCSTDGTEDVCRSAAKASGVVRINYRRNPRNVGAIANIVGLIEQSTTEYFLFLGDDDFLDPESLQAVVEVLHSVKPSAVLQASWPHHSVRASGIADFDGALTYFYEFGNSWAGLLHAATARGLLADRDLKQRVLATAWPQTALGFLSMWQLRHRASPYLLNREMGGPLPQARRRLETPEYWLRSLDGLVEAAWLVDRATAGRRATSGFIRWKNWGYASHLRAIGRERALANFRTLDGAALVAHVSRLGGTRGWVWSRIVQELCSGSLLHVVLVMGLSVKHRTTPKLTVRDLERRALERSAEVAAERAAGAILALEGLDGEGVAGVADGD